VPPFTASGVLKALTGAIDLARQLKAHDGIDEALDAWDAKQTLLGKGLYALEAHMEPRLIWQCPDYAALTSPRALEWWRQTTTPPPVGG
jgi:hypothetical protein